MLGRANRGVIFLARCTGRARAWQPAAYFSSGALVPVEVNTVETIHWYPAIDRLFE